MLKKNCKNFNYWNSDVQRNVPCFINAKLAALLTDKFVVSLLTECEIQTNIYLNWMQFRIILSLVYLFHSSYERNNYIRDTQALFKFRSIRNAICFEYEMSEVLYYDGNSGLLTYTFNRTMFLVYAKRNLFRMSYEKILVWKLCFACDS